MQAAVPVGRMSTSERFTEILRILIKHEAVQLVRRMAFREDPKTGERKPTPAPEVRQILEELGPSFIKIGQLLGTRPDLIGPEYIEEFKKLFDRTTPTPFVEVKPLLEAELGRPMSEVYATFEERPLASASIGQVHRAILRSGEEVAVKVQHPDIRAAMETDFRILQRLTGITERVFAASRVWQPVEHLEELHAMLDRELDYRNEVKTLRKVRANFADVPDVHIPKVYTEHCSERVIVMEFVRGAKLDALAATEKGRRATIGSNGDRVEIDTDGPTVARVVTHAMAKQIFIDRVFHADPSPGNILVRADGSVSFLDWGAVGMVTRRRARTIFNLIASLSRGDVEGVGRTILELCEVRGEIDMKRYQHDVEKLLDVYEKEDASPADPEVIELIIHLANEHNMLLPADFMLITRALYQFEGFCRQLDPDYELVDVLKPYVTNIMKEVLYGPERQKEIVSSMVTEYGELLQNMPGRISNVVRKLEKDEVALNLNITGLTGLKQANAKNARMMSFSVLVAAMVIGAGIVLAQGDPHLVGSFFFLASFLTAIWALVMLLSTWTIRHGD